jgi:tetratricopeptide (TPR) repeat protein
MSETHPEIPLKLHEVSVVYGKHVAIDGRLGGMNRKDFGSLIESKGGKLVELTDPDLDLIVLGAETQKFAPTIKQSAHKPESIAETKLWESLGFVEPETSTGRLYTPAMLAELLSVSISTIRRWHRRGLIRPLRQFKKLPYFDFEEVASARRIARLIAAGKSPEAIESKLAKIAEQDGAINRPLSQLSIIVEGKEVLLRKGDGLIEPGGQQVLSFGATEEDTHDDDEPALLSIHASDAELPESFELQQSDQTILEPDELIELAIDLEDEGDVEGAIDCYRTIGLSVGPSAEISFRIAELLYQNGDYSAARERYYNAVELEPSYVEARASLGCVLMELGQTDQAISCFEGALEQHEDYPDVHFHLAKLLTERGRNEEAIDHWKAFLELAPKSPWADDAKESLKQLQS